MFHAHMTTRRGVAAAVLVVAPLVAVASSGQITTAKAETRKDPTVTISASPQRLDLLPRPCIPALLTVGFHHQSGQPTYTSAFIRSTAPVRVSDEVVTTYVPPDYAATAPVEVRVPGDTPPGEYPIYLEAGRERVTVPVVVSAEPDDPNRNLALGQATIASSTGGVLDPCGAVDGNHTYTLLGYNRPATAWADATPSEFPDQVQTTLAKPAQIGRVDLYTHADRRFALRDWDVQALTDGGWQTVAQVRGHTAGRYSSRFAPVTASAVRINMLATNGYAYSTLVELEIYQQ
ncbi:discoidin domain-containing protein [Micromonospora yasonensis]|uniref:discoidin domain-containing protein n=1 Tax=Micromonospora yasonensis TaxID=1128667 RepID=UPI00222ED2C9|nr:discoidin domain-containing protein [Micromonospora yasonensis]MCW3838973.1 discoidin domain-containing protein [Micromonospora yasonensis]